MGGASTESDLSATNETLFILVKFEYGLCYFFKERYFVMILTTEEAFAEAISNAKPY